MSLATISTLDPGERGHRYSVSVYRYRDGTTNGRALWLAYLRDHAPRSPGFVGFFEVWSTSGPKAKAAAIREVKRMHSEGEL